MTDNDQDLEEPDDDLDFEVVDGPGYAMPGRRPKPLAKKIGESQRFLTTKGLRALIAKEAEKYSLPVSDYLRLCVLMYMINDNAMSVEDLNDPTWDTLRLHPVISEKLREAAKNMPSTRAELEFRDAEMP